MSWIPFCMPWYFLSKKETIRTSYTECSSCLCLSFLNIQGKSKSKNIVNLCQNIKGSSTNLYTLPYVDKLKVTLLFVIEFLVYIFWHFLWDRVISTKYYLNNYVLLFVDRSYNSFVIWMEIRVTRQQSMFVQSIMPYKIGVNNVYRWRRWHNVFVLFPQVQCHTVDFSKTVL